MYEYMYEYIYIYINIYMYIYMNLPNVLSGLIFTSNGLPATAAPELIYILLSPEFWGVIENSFCDITDLKDNGLVVPGLPESS